MKKVIAAILTLCALLSLASCADTGENAVSSASLLSSEAPSAASAEVSSVASTESADEVSSEEPEEKDIHHIFTEEDIVGVMPESLPVYHDGDIKLMGREEVYIAPNKRTTRYIYYEMVLDNMVIELPAFKAAWGEQYEIQMPNYEEWKEQYYGTDANNYFLPDDEEPEEMALVSFIKYYNIPREVMQETIDYYYNEWLPPYEPDVDHTEEMWEIPNLDIIYTLDNDIINEYYRYA